MSMFRWFNWWFPKKEETLEPKKEQRVLEIRTLDWFKYRMELEKNKLQESFDKIEEWIMNWSDIYTCKWDDWDVRYIVYKHICSISLCKR